MACSKSNGGEEIPKWKLARQGIQLLINNKARAAEALFKKYPDCIQLYAGYSFAVFMDALMTLEEDKLNLAVVTLKETERRCYAESGWLKMMKSKMFRSEICLADLENQIIIADTQVCMAILIFLQQDVSGIFKGGWILRKSWKIYQHTYNTIRSLYKEIVGELPAAATQEVYLPQVEEEDDGAVADGPETFSRSSPSNGYLNSHSYSVKKMTHSFTEDNLCNYKTKSHFNNNCVSVNECSSQLCSQTHDNVQQQPKNGIYTNFVKANLFLKKSLSVNNSLAKHFERKSLSFNTLPYFTSSFNFFTSERQTPHNIDKETMTRLMGAVSFGYGLFHLGISLLPPSLLRITNFLGFSGNRNLGISNLMYAREGSDMRAPLATLSLLWYHTIVRPFYAIDGSNVQAGVQAATQLMEESQVEYGKSALFLFFKGRIHRLNSNISEALSAFQASVDNSIQREIKILSLHEVGWCHLIRLDYQSAEGTFEVLNLSSRWSRSFYAYLSIICAGVCKSAKTSDKLKEIKKAFESNPKNSQLDIFLSRRITACPSTADRMENVIFWALFVYELLYLWNTLPSCSYTNIQRIISDCKNMTAEPMLGLSLLIEGTCHCILKESDDGIECFRKCLDARKHVSITADDAHISAFAQYELGQLLIKTPETKSEGKSLLKDTTQYRGYDFEQRLNLRIHSLIKFD